MVPVRLRPMPRVDMAAAKSDIAKALWQRLHPQTSLAEIKAAAGTQSATRNIVLRGRCTGAGRLEEFARTASAYIEAANVPGCPTDCLIERTSGEHLEELQGSARGGARVPPLALAYNVSTTQGEQEGDHVLLRALDAGSAKEASDITVDSHFSTGAERRLASVQRSC